MSTALVGLRAASVYEITKRDRVTVWPFRFATFRLSQPREAAGLRQSLDLLPCSICSRDQLDPLSYFS